MEEFLLLQLRFFILICFVCDGGCLQCIYNMPGVHLFQTIVVDNILFNIFLHFNNPLKRKYIHKRLAYDRKIRYIEHTRHYKGTV